MYFSWKIPTQNLYNRYRHIKDMVTVTIRFPLETQLVKKIDQIVRRGRYLTRSEFIRATLREEIEKSEREGELTKTKVFRTN